MSEEKQKKNFAADLFVTQAVVVAKRSMIHIALGAIPDLTELTRARNFLASRVPLGWRSKCGPRTRR